MTNKCENCDLAADPNYGSGRFCGKSCKDKFCNKKGAIAGVRIVIGESLKRFERSNKRCPNCNKCIDYKSRRNKFCSRTCAATLNNKNRIRVLFCYDCNEQLPKGARSKYCLDCGHNKAGEVPFDQLRSDKAAKRRLLKELAHKCEKCGNTEWNGEPIPLQMDHIDGNPDNRKRENLRLLCPNCHYQTPTWGGRNLGKFPNAERILRRELWRKKKRL